MPWINGSYDEIQDFVESKWGLDTALTDDDFNDIETALRTAYANYNNAMDNYSANVTVTADSTMNGALSGMINVKYNF